MGDAVKDGKLSDGVSGAIPLQLDLGYMVTPNIIGRPVRVVRHRHAHFEAKDLCDAAKVDCSASRIGVGLQGQYHLSPGQSLDPWFGLGFGLEMLDQKAGDTKSGVSGFEFVNIMAGADFAATESIAVGPFVNFSVGQYSKTTGDDGADIKDKAMHQWLTLGIKGTIGF